MNALGGTKFDTIIHEYSAVANAMKMKILLFTTFSSVENSRISCRSLELIRYLVNLCPIDKIANVPYNSVYILAKIFKVAFENVS